MTLNQQRQVNRIRQFRSAHLGNTQMSQQPQQVDPVAQTEADNLASAKRQQDWNTAAAQQYSQMQQQASAINVGQLNSEANRQLLGRAFGYDTSNLPSMGQLYEKFLTAPKNVQVGIYKKGFAPFLDDEDQQGIKSTEDVSKQLDAIHQQHQTEAMSAINKGEIGYDLDPKTGQPNWWQKQMVPNPNGSMLPPIEQHVPLNGITKKYLQDSINQGQLPDPTTGKYVDASYQPPTPLGRMTTDQFQDLLNARQGQPDAVDRFQDILNQRMGQGSQEALQDQPDSDVQSNFNFPSAPPSTNLSTQPQLTPASQAALAAQKNVGNLLQQGNESTIGNDALSAIGQTYLHDVPSAIGKGFDFVNTFLGGQPSMQPMQDTSTNPVPSGQMTPMDNALISAQLRQRMQQPTDTDDSNADLTSGQWGP